MLFLNYPSLVGFYSILKKTIGLPLSVLSLIAVDCTGTAFWCTCTPRKAQAYSEAAGADYWQVRVMLIFK